MNISSKDDCGRYVLDTENIRFVFAAVKDTILQLNLKEYNLVWGGGCCVLLLTMLLHVGACADDTRHVLTLAWQWHSIAKHGTPQLPWAATCFVVSVGILNQIAFVQKIYIHTHTYTCMHVWDSLFCCGQLSGEKKANCLKPSLNLLFSRLSIFVLCSAICFWMVLCSCFTISCSARTARLYHPLQQFSSYDFHVVQL